MLLGNCYYIIINWFFCYIKGSGIGGIVGMIDIVNV